MARWNRVGRWCTVVGLFWCTTSTGYLTEVKGWFDFGGFRSIIKKLIRRLRWARYPIVETAQPSNEKPNLTMLDLGFMFRFVQPIWNRYLEKSPWYEAIRQRYRNRLDALLWGRDSESIRLVDEGLDVMVLIYWFADHRILLRREESSWAKTDSILYHLNHNRHIISSAQKTFSTRRGY